MKLISITSLPETTELNGTEVLLGDQNDLTRGIPLSQIIAAVSVSASDTPIATTTIAGRVKPDGSTVTVTGDGTLSVSTYNLVPKTTTINSKPLTGNISLSATDIGLGNVTNVDTRNPANITQSANYRFVSDNEKTTWNNKQNALGFTPVPNTTTINNRPLSGNISITASDIGLSNVVNVDSTNAANITSGTISAGRLPTASTTSLGAVKVDGTTIVINNGVISSTASTGATVDTTSFVNKSLTINNHPLTGNFSINPSDIGLSDVTNDAQVKRSEMGVASGVATLGADSKIPITQLPSGIVGGLSYQGSWNASTNIPAIPAASASNNGFYYKVSVSGSTSIGGITDWKVGDWLISNGSSWDKIDNTDSVTSVNGQTGSVNILIPTTSIISVKDSPFNAVGNGISDDTAAIQSALTSAGASGGIVLFPQGKYKITSTLVVPQNVIIRGSGYSLDDSYLIKATTSLVVGATINGPVISIGDGTKQWYGNGIEDLAILLNDKAAVGIKLDAAVGGFYKNLFVLGNNGGTAPTVTNVAYLLTTSNSGTPNTNTMHNTFINVKASMVNTIFKFGYTNSSNVCHNTLTNVGGSYYTDGMYLEGADNNHYSMVFLFPRPSATGYGVQLIHGLAYDSHFFYQLQAGSGLYVGPNASGVVFGYDKTNGQSDPVLADETSQLSWTSDSANSNGWHISGNINVKANSTFTDGTISKTLAQLATGASDGSVYYATSAAAITSQLAAASAAGGGTVVVAPGTFQGKWVIPDKVSIRGAGKGVTILQLPNATTGNVIQTGNYSKVSDLTIDGNKLNQVNATSNTNYGLLVYYKNQNYIHNIEVKNTNGIGIGVHTAYRVTLSNCYVHDTLKVTDRAGAAGQVGIWCMTDNHDNMDLTIEDCVSEYCGLDGIIISGDGVTVNGGHFNYNGYGMPMPGVGGGGIYTNETGVSDIIITSAQCRYNTGIGLDIPAASNITITGCFAEYNNNAGIGLFDVKGGTLVGNVVSNNGQNAQVDWQDAGIVIRGDISSTGITAIGNTSFDNQGSKTQKYGILVTGNVNNSIVVSNSAYGNNIDIDTSGVTGSSNTFTYAQTSSFIDDGSW